MEPAMPRRLCHVDFVVRLYKLATESNSTACHGRHIAGFETVFEIVEYLAFRA